MLRVWVQSCKRVAGDSMILCTEFYKGHRYGSSPVGVALLNEQAASHNLAAQSILFMYKELNLLRYKGLSQYVSDRSQFYRKISSEKRNGVIDESIEKREPRKAKVAFMITKSQKSHLRTELGFTDDAIRKLTPDEALIIIDNKLRYRNDDTFSSKLKELCEHNEKLKLLENEQKLRMKDTCEDTGDEVDDKISRNDDIDMGANRQLALLNNESDASAKKSSATPPLNPDQNLDANEDERYWFEVIQVRSNGKQDAIALYDNETEAQNCAQWKGDREKNKSDKLSFFVRRRNMSDHKKME